MSQCDYIGLVAFLSVNVIHTQSLCTAALAFLNARFGQGTGLIVLDQLACTGTETRLIDCSHRGFNTTGSSCGHDDDAGVRCTSSEYKIYYRMWYMYQHEIGIINNAVDWKL